jgi:quinol monooxygenase YgiN
MSIRGWLAAALFACGCGDVPQVSDAGDPPDMTAPCVEDDLSSPGPFAGPGYDPQSGIIGTPQAQYVAHATVIRLLPDPAKQQQFGAMVGPVIGRLVQSPGLVGFQVASSQKCGTARTVGVWKDISSMYAFVASDEHQAAAAKTYDVAAGGAFTHWNVSPAQVPVTWQVAMEKLAAKGGR